MKYLLVASLWTGYCTLHSYLISVRFTKLATRLLKKYYAFYRIFYVLISFVLLVPLMRFSFDIDTNIIIVYSAPLTAVRYALMFVSLAIFVWAFFIDYDFLSFFGIRQILNIGKKNNSAQPEELRKKGLLGIVRHPMYFALIIFIWCQTFRMTDIVVNIVLTVYVVIGTVLEERKLVLEYGDSYVNYKHEVPMLIPFTGKHV